MNFTQFLQEQPEREPKRQRSRKPEEQQRTQTRTRERPEVEPDLSAFDRDPSAGKQAPAPYVDPVRTGRTERLGGQKPELKQASAEQTTKALGDVEMHPDAMDKLADLMGSGLEDVLSDEQAARLATGHHTPGFTSEPKTPTKSLAVIEKMPKIIGKKMAKEGMIEPDWHQVKHLPGYMVGAIRAIGRAVFAPFTDTPIEKIQVVANLGNGPNKASEVNSTLDWLHKHARRDTEAELWFEDQIPDYEAKVICYKAMGFTFLAVKDFAGNYIYSWPTTDEKQLTDQHWDD